MLHSTWSIENDSSDGQPSVSGLASSRLACLRALSPADRSSSWPAVVRQTRSAGWGTSGTCWGPRKTRQVGATEQSRHCSDSVLCLTDGHIWGINNACCLNELATCMLTRWLLQLAISKEVTKPAVLTNWPHVCSHDGSCSLPYLRN
jgi:hypothetical protein